ncbi:hypothetical protein SADUNF_Sadunf12G0050000 [Salix dunnii]|uniref:Uncharacterized protein n=1 Tax=Salix dunnii TaxID=1413687 RepID=A0A835JN32_9ROSI|nr:hypothetical protein SADUNF_Sadunf12G0050000 [Salix dunnii]
MALWWSSSTTEREIPRGGELGGDNTEGRLGFQPTVHRLRLSRWVFSLGVQNSPACMLEHPGRERGSQQGDPEEKDEGRHSGHLESVIQGKRKYNAKRMKDKEEPLRLSFNNINASDSWDNLLEKGGNDMIMIFVGWSWDNY